VGRQLSIAVEVDCTRVVSKGTLIVVNIDGGDYADLGDKRPQGREDEGREFHLVTERGSKL
jgi:hypothetical protein